MFDSNVGDDVYGEDPTINYFQDKIAKLFGKEKALFVPSGTMGNLIANITHCNRGEAIILGNRSHIYLYEAGGVASLGSVFPISVNTNSDGTLPLELLEKAIPPQNYHFTKAKAICLENTHNTSGGRVLPQKYVDDVKKICDNNNLKLHLDGARALNASVFLNIKPHILFKNFDSISFCLSKGMGCPVGSVLLGNEEFISKANYARKMIGGGMRQAGVLAACGLVALDDWEFMLREDYNNAKLFANLLHNNKSIIIDPELVESNIVIFALNNEFTKRKCKELSNILKEKYSLLMNPLFEGDKMRMVTHRDIDKGDIEYAVKCINEILNN